MHLLHMRARLRCEQIDGEQVGSQQIPDTEHGDDVLELKSTSTTLLQEAEQ